MRITARCFGLGVPQVAPAHANDFRNRQDRAQIVRRLPARRSVRAQPPPPARLRSTTPPSQGQMRRRAARNVSICKLLIEYNQRAPSHGIRLLPQAARALEMWLRLLTGSFAHRTQCHMRSVLCRPEPRFNDPLPPCSLAIAVLSRRNPSALRR
jgi:hypothetical protein